MILANMILMRRWNKMNKEKLILQKSKEFNLKHNMLMEIGILSTRHIKIFFLVKMLLEQSKVVLEGG
ncbi:MAG: hypothetical protein DBX91_04295 [Subdoligranulum variabile]|nr:MAG: hypothetical protein DBX91_04295 [Subdoligranulum variabile]